MEIRFFKLEEIILIHKEQINLFGGIHGIRDRGLLESAVYAPQSTFAGKFLHKDIRPYA
jgi:death on curing protein